MIVVKGNKFWFFALFSMLVVFSAVPTWADSWVSVGGNTYYYNNASVADSGTGYIAAESAELDENGFYNITADQLNTMSKEEKASMEKIKLDSSFSNIINDSVSLVNLLNDFTGVTTLDISEINFKADASDNSGSTTPTVTLDLTQLPANVKTVSIANNTSITDVKLNSSLEEFSATGCSNFKKFKLSDAGEVSVAATPALKKTLSHWYGNN